jgi:2-polyprenyl-3-methyl-5-hydroxy-6-metoxy-1,4-benzoquinol methylase
MTSTKFEECASTKVERTDEVRSFFDKPQNYLDRKRFDIRLRAETTQTFLKGQAFDKIIDIGCGDGSVSLPLLTAGGQLTLVDLSSNMLSLARSRVPAELAANVEFHQRDFLEVPFEERSYDVVICMGVLAHVVSPLQVIRRAASLLRDEGTLILECTDSFHFMRRLMTIHGRLLAKIRPPGYRLSELSAADVLRMAEESGLKLENAFHYSWPVPGSQRIFSQNALYHMVRSIFGDATHNRNRWLGYEHIFCLRRR